MFRSEVFVMNYLLLVEHKCSFHKSRTRSRTESRHSAAHFHSLILVDPCNSGASNLRLTEILEHFQSKTLRIITDASWYVPNETIRKGLQIPTAKEEISRHSTKYGNSLCTHPKKTHSKSSRTSKKMAIAKTPVNRSAHQIQYVIVVVVNLVIKV
jgi:hypothetical protein